MMLDWALAPERVIGVAALVVGYAALCARVAWVTRARRLGFSHTSEELAAHSQWPAVLVTFASQTGQAESLARETAKMMGDSGFRVTLLPIDLVTESVLRMHEHSLWMLSTTGEGDAPDHALRFVQQTLTKNVDLQGHQCQVLALGDHEYQQFCAFGAQVHEWLASQGASSDLVCVDNMDPTTLQAWQLKISALRQAWLGSDAMAATTAAQEEWLLPASSTPFTLQRRVLLNPGSLGGALYRLDWVAAAGAPLPHWQSGDLASLKVPAAPDHARDYSIASIVEDGCLQMLVRLSVREDGTQGVASGWICRGMREGDSLDLSIRQHSSFRLGDNAERPLILIGNGSGLAGLLSHVKERIQRGRGDQWLIFGERNPAHDAICGEQLVAWRDGGQLERLDFAWSRGEAGRVYVQDVVRAQGAEIQSWMDRGAAIYVCGSLQGMGQGVHQALQEVLGEDGLQALTQAGRYRRDVY